MTRRSMVLGFGGGIGLAVLVFYSDQIKKNTFLTGNFLPPVVFGALLGLVLLINPLLRLVRRRPLSAAEMAFAAGLWLVACFPAGRSFSHFFGNFLMLPHHWARVTPAWSGDPVRVRPEQIRDLQGFVQSLKDGLTRAPGDGLREIAVRVAAEHNDVIPDGRDAVFWAEALNRLIDQSDWVEEVHAASLVRPMAPYARFRPRGPSFASSSEARAAKARAILEAALPQIEPRRPALLEAVPPRIFADPSADPRRMLDGYVMGLRTPNTPFRLRDVPWVAWQAPLRFWLPLIYAFVVCSLGLGILLHRQWARHEMLPFPAAEAIRGLLPEAGHWVGPALRDRRFWIAAGIVFGLHMLNYLNRWFPDYALPVRLRFDFSPLLELMPVFRHGGGPSLFMPTLFFTAVGFAFYLSSDVSFSLGIGPFLYVLVAGTAAGLGVSFSTGEGHLSLDIASSIYGGAVVATFLALWWSGRHYFGAAFKSLFQRHLPPDLTPTDRWGARLALLGFAAFIIQLRAIGVEWPIAFLYSLFTMMIFVAIARLMAEGGAIFYHPYGSSCVIVWLFMGTSALGYPQLLLISLVSTMFLIESREAFLPLALTALKAADDQGVPIGRLTAAGAVLVAIALLAAVISSLYWQYREGALQRGDAWTNQGIPRMSLNIVGRVIQDAQARGELGQMHAQTPWGRWRQLAPRNDYLLAFGVAFVLVLLLTWLRRRYAGWPLHPIFLMLGPTYEGRVFAFSFLVGWLIKRLALKYGGARTYQQLKAPMLGLVFGEVFATVVPLLVGVIYSAMTGKNAPTLRVLPG